jgi:hypothetical protein
MKMAGDGRNPDPVRSGAQGQLIQTAPADPGRSRVARAIRPIRRGALIALLIFWPLLVTVGQMWFPSASGLNFPFAIASLIFYAACSLVLRSRTIAGTLLGLSIYPFTGPTVYPDHDWKTRLLGCGILGLVWGIAWEAIHSLRPSKPELPRV